MESSLGMASLLLTTTSYFNGMVDCSISLLQEPQHVRNPFRRWVVVTGAAATTAAVPFACHSLEMLEMLEMPRMNTLPL